MPVLVGAGDKLVLRNGSQSSLARPSVPLSAFYGGGGVQLVGENRFVSYTNVYRTQALVYTVVNVLTRLMATLPLKVYRRDGNRDKERVYDSPLATLIREPAPRCSTGDLAERIALDALVFGNCLLYKVREDTGAPPRYLVPLDWRFVTPQGEDGGPVEFWSTGQFGDTRHLAVEDVVHVAWQAPGCSVGISPLQPLAVTLALEDAALRYSTAAFTNGNRPTGALVLPEGVRLKPDERDKLKAEIASQHGGVDNAFSIALLQNGMRWEAFSQNAEEAELVALRQRNREEVAAAFGMSGPMVNDLTHGTFSNVTELYRQLYESVVRPWLTMIEGKLAAQLVRDEQGFDGDFVEFDYADRLRGDRTQELAVLREAAGGPIYTRNEARRALNLARVDDPEADRLVTTNNMVGAEDPREPVVDPVKGYLERAVNRVASKMGAGVTDAWDRDRFLREVRAEGANGQADVLADQLEQAFVDAAGDPAVFRRLAVQ